MRFITKTDEILYILIRILSSWTLSIIYLYKNEKKHAASQNKLQNCIESYKDLVTMGLSLYETNRVETRYDETKFSKSENLLLKSGGILSHQKETLLEISLAACLNIIKTLYYLIMAFIWHSVSFLGLNS